MVGEIEGGPAELPVAEAGFFPFVEVLFGDGQAVEDLFEHSLDFGLGVEPVEELFVFFAVIEAAIEFVAEVTGDLGDFADVLHMRNGLRKNV